MTHDQSNEISKNLGRDDSDITLPKNTSDEGESAGASACNTSVRCATPEHDVYTPASACTAMTKKGKPCSALTCSEAREQELNLCSGHLIAAAKGGTAEVPAGWSERMARGMPRGMPHRYARGMPGGTASSTSSGHRRQDFPPNHADSGPTEVKRMRNLHLALSDAEDALDRLFAAIVGEEELTEELVDRWNAKTDELAERDPFACVLHALMVRPLGHPMFKGGIEEAGSDLWDADLFIEKIANPLRDMLRDGASTSPSEA